MKQVKKTLFVGLLAGFFFGVVAQADVQGDVDTDSFFCNGVCQTTFNLGLGQGTQTATINVTSANYPDRSDALGELYRDCNSAGAVGYGTGATLLSYSCYPY